MNDAQAHMLRFLEEVAAAFDVDSGAVYWRQDGLLGPLHQYGNWNGDLKLSVPMTSPSDATPFGLIALAARRNGEEYSPGEHAILEQTAALVARAIKQDSRTVSSP